MAKCLCDKRDSARTCEFCPDHDCHARLLSFPLLKGVMSRYLLSF